MCSFYRSQTKFANVMFSQASFCSQGDLPHCMLGHTPLGRHPPPGRHPPGRQPPGRQPPGRHPPGRQPPGRRPLRSVCWDTVNKRAVRIPLECILVLVLLQWTTWTFAEMAGIKKRPYPSLMAHPNNEHSTHKIIRPIRKFFPRYPLSLPFHRIFLGKTCKLVASVGAVLAETEVCNCSMKVCT